ncbi:Disintegrin [Ancylostoma ceylanicum]|uniref:Disintegrin n=1 Tax=Ancylostoma ceylanicum TaxID=53326 RepID=A0A0D6LKJ6_9BILA|nr:Disintegrin [Ancylostoma ceylanicum]
MVNVATNTIIQCDPKGHREDSGTLKCKLRRRWSDRCESASVMTKRVLVCERTLVEFGQKHYSRLSPSFPFLAVTSTSRTVVAAVARYWFHCLLLVRAASKSMLVDKVTCCQSAQSDQRAGALRHPAPRANTLSSTHLSECFFEEETNGILNTLSACTSSTISGIISTGPNYFILDAKNATDFILSPQTVDSCELTTRSKREAKTNKSTLPAYYSEYNDGKWRYVELALVADYSVFAKYDKDEAKVMERLQTIAHHVNALYYPLNIRITLVWVDIWKDGDKFEVATSGDRTLDHFLNYRKGIIKAHPNDNAHMLTDIRFDASVVGKAFKGTMCSYDYSGGVDVDHSDNAAVVAATVAHEMGHNFGMEHDVDYGTTCNCPGNHCVMAPSTGLRYLYNSFNRGVDLCLKNPPEKTIGGAKCGNGIVEPGETLCRNVTVAENNVRTPAVMEKLVALQGMLSARMETVVIFSLASHPQESFQFLISLSCSLLEKCFKPKPRATMCRAPVGICDLPEYCNGDTPDCPADFFIQNGDEYCYEGQCGSRPDQCVSIWGPTGKEGTETHQCHVIKTTYVVGQKNKPDPGMVLDGSECGDNKICVNAKCKPLSEVSKTVSKCNDHCHYRGVCNNVGNCHCENGFGGIACEIPGFGGSNNTIDSVTGTSGNIIACFDTHLLLLLVYEEKEPSWRVLGIHAEDIEVARGVGTRQESATTTEEAYEKPFFARNHQDAACTICVHDPASIPGEDVCQKDPLLGNSDSAMLTRLDLSESRRS